MPDTLPETLNEVAVLKLLRSIQHMWATGKQIQTFLNVGIPWWKFWERWTRPQVYNTLVVLCARRAVDVTGTDLLNLNDPKTMDRLYFRIAR